LSESGIDLVFLNWRGVLAPPGISDERRGEMIGYLQQMHDTDAWQEQLQANGWTDDFKTGDDFTSFIEEQDERVSGTLDELGLI
jgi:putative tricarboxylic transport membrane protein